MAWFETLLRLRNDALVAARRLYDVLLSVRGAAPIRADPTRGPTGPEIIADNVRAMRSIYVAAMLEELKLFQVCEKLVELFGNGTLPITRGSADALAVYEKERPRLSEAARRSVYARTLGLPGGDDGGMPNREFNELWQRFLVAVSSCIRQGDTIDPLCPESPGVGTQNAVRKAGRDLAAHLSFHGSSETHSVADTLQKELHDAVTLVSADAITSAYAAHDMWQVIDRVATSELGGVRNSVRYRTLATSGATVIAWLAQHAEALSTSSPDPVLDLAEIHSPTPAVHGHNATTDPTDDDLFQACERWRAASH